MEECRLPGTPAENSTIGPARFFDDLVIGAIGGGTRQVVLVGAGNRARLHGARPIHRPDGTRRFDPRIAAALVDSGMDLSPRPRRTVGTPSSGSGPCGTPRA